MPDLERGEMAAADLSAEMARSVSQVHLTVFVCGPNVPNDSTPESLRPEQIIRKLISEKIRNCGHRCYWGEHLVEGGDGNRNDAIVFDDAAREIRFALKTADFVVIFPSSPGSYAELGSFCMHEHICPKMLVFFKAEYEHSTSFLTVAVKKAAEEREAKTYFVDYRNVDEIWRRIESVLSRKCRVRVTTLDYVRP
jgi:hypothetical protein